MSIRSEYVHQGCGDDLTPVCPRCAEMNAPLARVCDCCGSYLIYDDALRDLQVSLIAARTRRYPQAGDDPVDENLLDIRHGDRLPSSVVTAADHREAPSARKEGRP